MRRARWPFQRAVSGERVGLGLLHDEGFIALDLETTGLDPRRDAIVAAAAIPFARGRAGEGFVTLVDPARPIPPASTAIHGITNAMVIGAPRAAAVVEQLEVLLGRHVLVGHGVAFDIAVLDRERRDLGLGQLDNPVLDTRALAAALRPAWAHLELEGVAARLGVPVVARHTAEGDAVTAGRILLALLEPLRALGIRTVADVLRFQESAPPPS